MVEHDIITARWHDRTILLAEWKLGVMNKIVMRDKKRFPEPLYISGQKAMQYPVNVIVSKQKKYIKMRAIPIDAFTTEVSAQ